MKLLLAVVFASLVALAACGGSGSWCPGTICSNCATDPACNITCGAGKIQACVGGSYFGADPNLRCAYCP